MALLLQLYSSRTHDIDDLIAYPRLFLQGNKYWQYSLINRYIHNHYRF